MTHRPTWSDKRGLEIALLMDRESTAAFLPRRVADRLAMLDLVDIVDTPKTSLGLERLVKLTDRGRETANALQAKRLTA